MNKRIQPLLALLVGVTFSLVSVTAAFAEKPATVAKEDEDDFVDRDGQVIHFTGSHDARNQEAEAEMKRWAKIKRVDLANLSDSEKLTFVAEMIKTDKSLSPNALRSLFNSGAVMKMFMSSPEIAKENGLSKEGQAKRIEAATEILKAVATRFDLPDAYWNFKVDEKEADKLLNEVGAAMGRAIGEGLGKGITEAFTNAIINIFEPSKDSIVTKISEALVETMKAFVPAPKK